jgi:hypothetical protein
MNYKSTILLLVLVAVLGGYFLFSPEKTAAPVEDGPVAGVEAGGVTGKPVLDGREWTLEKIDGVGFADGRQTMVAKREGEDWMLVEPVRWRMNEHDIPNLINVATGVKYFDKMTKGADLKDLRLEPAAVSLTLYPKDGKEPLVLEVGRLGVAGAGYLKIKGKPEVYVVEDSLHKLVLDRDVTDWRSQSLAGAPGPERADLLSVKTGTDGFKLARVKGKWVIDGEMGGRADQDAVNAFVFGLGRSYAAKFIADKPADLARYGLDKPQAVIQVSAPEEGASTQPSDKATARKMGTLSIGSPSDLTSNHYYAMWSSTGNPSTVVFTLTKMEAEKYMRPVNTYRDRRLVSMPLSDIMRVEGAFSQVGKPITLTDEKEGGYALKLEKDVWVFDDGKAGVVKAAGVILPGLGGALKVGVEVKPDTPTVNALLARLASARATGFEEGVDLKVSGREKPAYVGSIELVGLGGINREMLLFYEQDPATWKVQRANMSGSGVNYEPMAMVVAKKELPGVTATKQHLLDRSIINVIPGQVASLEIDRAQSAYPGKYVLTRVSSAKTGEEPGDPAADKWVLADGSPAETGAVNRILELVAPLRASSRGGKMPEKAGGSVIRVTVVSKEGQRFEIGVTPGSGEGESVLFTGAVPAKDATMLPTGPKGLMAVLEGELRSRSMLPVSADQLATVTINPTTDLITINQGNKGSYRNPDGKVIDPTKIGPMFDVLGGLRAERILEAPKAGVEGELRREFAILTKDGSKWTLKLYTTPGGNVGVLAGPVKADAAGKTGEMRVFKLSAAAMDRLMVDVILKVKRAPSEQEGEINPAE